LFPLAVGGAAFACPNFIHAIALFTTVDLVRHERKTRRAGTRPLMDLANVSVALALCFVEHLVLLARWAVLRIACWRCWEFGDAFYQSAVNYTTLGYGDVLLAPSLRLLGPLEAANGVLMFGVSAAMVFAVIQRLLVTRYQDLKS